MRTELSRSLAFRLHLDVPLILGLLALSAIGLLVLYSAGGQSTDLLSRQAVRLGMAFVIMFVVAQIAPVQYRYWAPWLYGSGLVLLVLVLVAGDAGGGAARWLNLGPVRFQPSELLKVTVPMMVAYYLAERALPPTLGRIALALVVALLPTWLIARQPDLGTALLVASSGLFVLFLAGITWRLLALAATAAIAAAPVLWHFMHDYQRKRVITFLDPEKDPLNAGYHIIQSKIAIGSGGVYGKGLFNGTQSQLEFLPERSTDFIFAVLSEEFGFTGVVILLMVYAFVILRGLYLALAAQETFARLLGGGVVLTFFMYVFVNIGMVSGLLPVVGVPLPLVSYGGTSMVTIMAAFGLLMSVHTHRRLLSE
ncbi:MAG: rod shape-determining protein RodA [Gammaproteobacteria bacterium]|nr:rod shape-determining protein RodA [Gammaproteobacteria bacterium]